jgi:murein DD-endopeptidase MepM/ murein hydrolase activator NlpD
MDQPNQDKLNYLSTATKVNRAIERTSPTDRACNLIIFSLVIWGGIYGIGRSAALATTNPPNLVESSQNQPTVDHTLAPGKVINSQTLSVLKLINFKQILTRVQLNPKHLSTPPSQRIEQLQTIANSSQVSPLHSSNSNQQLITNLHPSDSKQLNQKVPSKTELSQPSIVVSEIESVNPEVEADHIHTDASDPELKNDSKGTTKSKVIGVAPISVDNYNPNLNLTPGTLVEPQLPPLLPPEQYLPNNPTQFEGFIWPAEGVLTSGYGMRWGRMHKGIDIAGPVGTPIYAAGPGEIVYAAWNSGGYGNLVKIEHPDGTITIYAHNSKLMVNKGEFVQQGQQIAAMGSTGRSTGPHLHFEIHQQGTNAINPIALLPKK